MAKEHTDYMKLCLKLAKKGEFLTSPNPLVGSILVDNANIISQGYHKHYSAAHAERACLDNIKEYTISKHAVLYVNLEPCSHFGKTPPCADYLIERGLKHVVIGCMDSSKKVNGQGIEKLKSAGVEVSENVLKDECRFLNRRFFTFHEKKRPYIVLKWAETKDGFIADRENKSKWISSEQSRELVHLYRAEEAAILIGYNTAKYDNPFLTARPASLDEKKYNQPTRVFLDRNLSLPQTIHLYNNHAKSIIINQIKQGFEGVHEFVKIDFSAPVIEQIIEILHTRNINSLLVEGGTKLLQSFIERELYDEARVFISPKKFESGVRAPKIGKTASSVTMITEDTLKIYTNHDFVL